MNEATKVVQGELVGHDGQSGQVPQVPAAHAQRVSLVEQFAARYSVDPRKLLTTLKATAFRQQDGKDPVTDEQMMALLVVANQYKLNPFTREIYAFPDKGGIVPIVGVDGWSSIINDHKAFDGMTFATQFAGDGPDAKVVAVTCTMFRKDRNHPTIVTEYLAECRRPTAPWTSHPARMLRHKAMMQCARMAFGFTGIFDEDEGERVIQGSSYTVAPDGVADLNREISAEAAAKAGGGQGVQATETAKPAPAEAQTSKPAAQIEPGSTIDPPAATQVQGADGGTGAPGYATIAAAIGKAKTTDELDQAADMIRSLPVEAMRAELDVEARAKRKQLEAGAKK
jgi:phage recombination protein Bet